MVWTPDALVTQYMTRDTAPDASNRARHHCNACFQVFPLGPVREMRDHLLNCPSLSANTIARIQKQIQNEETTPKTTVRDPRWTNAEEETLLKMDAELGDSKNSQRYVKMATALPGRSAQACRQKLLHVKQAERERREQQDSSKGAGSNVTTRSQKAKKEEQDEERESEEEPTGKGKDPANLNDSNATKSHDGTTFRSLTRTGRTAADEAEEFVRLTRWALHEVFYAFGIAKNFYTSAFSLQEGWNAFVDSKIPSKDKNRTAEKLYAQWLNSTDVPGFDREVNLHIDSIIQDLSNWNRQFATVDKEYYFDEGEELENAGTETDEEGEEAENDENEDEEVEEAEDDDEDEGDDGSEYED